MRSQAAGEVAPVASTSAPKKAPKGNTSGSNPFANYSNASSLGLYNEAADQLVQEINAKRTESKVGQWETVAPRPVASTSAAVDPDADEERVTFKRLAKEKTAPGMDELYDPGAVGFKMRKRRRPGQAAEVKEEVKEEPPQEEGRLKGFKLAIAKPVKQEEGDDGEAASKKRKVSQDPAPDPPAVRPKAEEEA
jgi:hypothetical protein